VPVPSEAYDRDYFLSELCEGWDRFREDRGLSLIKQRQVEILAPGPGMRVLDAGCGRGEVLLACAGRGAEVAGIDYAQAAVDLARETLADTPAVDVRRGEVTGLPWPDASFDRILFADVIEHIDPEQSTLGLRELHRVLRPGGMLLVHTAPNLLFLKFGWPVGRLLLRAVGEGDAVRSLDDWIASSKRWHVNEQSIFSLRRGLRDAGFSQVTAWIDPNVLRQGQHHLTAGLTESRVTGAADRMARTRPLRLFLGNDLYALARR
jgi:ubiquinone/menaquinone biosynthesis C-methylase UbiE